VGFSQNNRKYDRCEKEIKEDSILFKKIITESKHVNYTSLTYKIMDDIDKSLIPEDNLIILYHEKRRINPFDEEPCFCCYEILAEHPVYNDTIFWTKNHIKILVKKLQKNIIPKDATRGNFIYGKADRNFKKFTIFRKLIDATKRQEIGTYQKKALNANYENISDEEKFYYFPFNHKKNLVITEDNTSSEPKDDFNTLELVFFNEINNKVIVQFIYNEKYNEAYSKTYQYKNREWELIENPFENE
jgi:hypothetical protein